MAVLVGLCLAGCGTTSGLKLADGKSAADLARLNKVVVGDFADKASQKVSGDKQAEKRRAMTRVTRDFADMLCGEIERSGLFQKVSRTDSPDAETLLIVIGKSRVLAECANHAEEQMKTKKTRQLGGFRPPIVYFVT